MRPRFRLSLLAVLLGLLTQLGQLFVFRELLADFHGSELLFGLILGCGLLAAAGGCALASRMSGPGERRGAARRCLWPVALYAPVLAGTLLLARWLGGEGLAGSLPPLRDLALVVAAVTAPGAFLSGMQFGLLLRLTRRAGGLYRAECLGMCVGGIAATLLLARLGCPLLLVLLAGAVAAGACVRLLRLRGWRPAVLALLPLGLAAAAWLLPLEWLSEAWRWRGLSASHVLREFRDTPYGRIALLAARAGGQISVYQNGELCATLEAQGRDVVQRADLYACLHPAPRTALVIGDTLTGLPEVLRSRHGLRRVEAVVPDPSLRALARSAAERVSAESARGVVAGAFSAEGVPETGIGKVAYLVADGRGMLNAAPEGGYELLVVSLPEPDNAGVNRFCTVEFFRAARRALDKEGVLVLQLPAYGSGGEYVDGPLAARTGSVLAAMREVFPHVAALPVDGHLLVASKARFSLLPEVLGERLAARGAVGQETAIAYFCGLYGGVLAFRPTLEGELEQSRIEQFRSDLAVRGIHANEDLHPAAILQGMMTGMMVAEGNRQYAEVYQRTLQRLQRYGWLTLLLPVALAAVLWVWTRKRGAVGRRRTAGLFAAAGMGAFAMLAEIALLNAYQNLRGNLYQEIGALMALFVLGMALGSGAARREGRWQGMPVSWLLLLAGGAALILPGIFRLPEWTGEAVGALLILPAMFGCGALSGWAYRLLAALPGEGGTWAGRVYAADLAGGAAGALLGGAVWLPLCGISLALGGVVLWLAAALLLWRLARPLGQTVL